MFKKLSVFFVGLICSVSLSFGALTPEIERDDNGVPGAAIQGKTSGGTRVEVRVDSNGNIGTYGAAGSTTTFADERFVGKISSGGVGGYWNGVSSGTIVVANNVTRFSFKYNSSTTENCIINPTGWTSGIPLWDQDSVSEVVDIPCPITFRVTGLAVGATFQYSITVIK